MSGYGCKKNRTVRGQESGLRSKLLCKRLSRLADQAPRLPSRRWRGWFPEEKSLQDQWACLSRRPHSLELPATSERSCCSAREESRRKPVAGRGLGWVVLLALGTSSRPASTSCNCRCTCRGLPELPGPCLTYIRPGCIDTAMVNPKRKTKTMTNFVWNPGVAVLHACLLTNHRCNWSRHLLLQLGTQSFLDYSEVLLEGLKVVAVASRTISSSRNLWGRGCASWRTCLTSCSFDPCSSSLLLIQGSLVLGLLDHSHQAFLLLSPLQLQLFLAQVLRLACFPNSKVAVHGFLLRFVQPPSGRVLGRHGSKGQADSGAWSGKDVCRKRKMTWDSVIANRTGKFLPEALYL